MRLNFNDIRYIVNEAAKRIIEAQGGSSMVTKEFGININDIEVPTFFDDEIDSLSGGEVRVRCEFMYHKGQSGYDAQPMSEEYVLSEVYPADNSELRENVSPDLFDAIMDGAERYVWDNSEEFEESMLRSDRDYQEYQRDFDYDMRRKNRY